MFHLCFLYSLFRVMSMSCDQRLCPGVGGRRCGEFMSPIFRDPQPTCTKCRGIKCMADVTCDICKDWSVAHWEPFLKRRPYSGSRKKRPPGSALPHALQPPPPSASASSEAGRPAPTPRSLPLLLRGMTTRRGWRVSREVPPPSSLIWREVRGEAPRKPWLLRARAIRLIPPFLGRG